MQFKDSTKATRIRIEVEAGGRKLIRIADNGHVMVRDHALLALRSCASSCSTFKLHPTWRVDAISARLEFYEYSATHQ
jgi:hypothetical protein